MGSYAIGAVQRPAFAVSITLFILVTLIITLVSAAPNYVYRRISDECDWSGSGLEQLQRGNVGVQPVYLRCTEGSIEWHYPRNALRVVLRMGHTNKDFRGCIKVSKNSSGAILYLEGHQTLRNLFHQDDGKDHEGLETCFESTGGQAALFLEARGPFDSLKKDVIKFMYDLQPVNQRLLSECRPCTEREMLYLFCTSDFVVRGTITSLYQNEPMQRTELIVKANDILRDSEPTLFSHKLTVNKGSIARYGTFHRPLQCGTRVGSGEFLFLGKWTLGSPILTCAPRWSEWKKVRRKAILSENIDCLLE